MTNTWKTGIALIPMIAMSSDARAGDALAKAADELTVYALAVETATSRGADADYSFLAERSKCDGWIAAAVKAGASDDTRLHDSEWPKDLPSYQDGSITLAAARDVCDAYATWRLRVKAAATVKKAVEGLAMGDSGGWIPYDAGDTAKTCLAQIDDLDAASRSVAVKIGDGTMTLEDGRAVCEQLAGAAAKQSAGFAAEDADKKAAIEEKYRKAGMKGARLKLFVDNELNGGGFAWYAKGCSTEVTDLKKLAKAKKLFQWTNGASGGTLVTRYTFKGSKYREEQREFFVVENAYAWCK